MAIRTATTLVFLIAVLVVEDFRFGNCRTIRVPSITIPPESSLSEDLLEQSVVLKFNFTKSKSDVLVKFFAAGLHPYYALVTLNDGYLTFTAIGPNIFIQERLVSSCNCRLNDGKPHRFVMILSKRLGAFFFVDFEIAKHHFFELNQEPSPESNRIANQTFQRQILIYSAAKVDMETLSIEVPGLFRNDGPSSLEIF